MTTLYLQWISKLAMNDMTGSSLLYEGSYCFHYMRCENHQRSGVTVSSNNNILGQVQMELPVALHVQATYCFHTFWEPLPNTRNPDTADLTGSLDVREDAPHALDLAKLTL